MPPAVTQEQWMAAGAAVAIVAAFFLVNWISVANRADAIEEMAKKLGFTFRREGDLVMQNRIPALALFHEGFDAAARNFVEDPPMIAFDYQFQHGHGKSQRVFHCTVVAFEVATMQRESKLVHDGWILEASGRWVVAYKEPIQRGWPIQARGWPKPAEWPAYLEAARTALENGLGQRLVSKAG